MKIYCKDCRYYKTFVGVLGSYNEYCRSPKNVKETHRGIERQARDPDEINKNIDCPWFEAGQAKHVNLL